MAKNRRISHAVVIGRAGDGSSAYVPDLPRCIATAATVADVKREIAGAIRFRIEGLCADGEPVPAPTALADPARARSPTGEDDPFAAFTEWSGEIDEADYADL